MTVSPSAICPSLSSVLADRHSVREFASRPVPAQLLAGACRTGFLIEGAYWPAGVHGESRLGIAVATAHSQDFAAGIHVFSAAEASFGHIGGEALFEELWQSYVPQTDASSLTLILVYGALGSFPRKRPGSTYQATLVRAAALGHATMLAAMGSGLVGCPFGRATSQVSAFLSTSLASPSQHLFTVALGWPRDTDRRISSPGS